MCMRGRHVSSTKDNLPPTSNPRLRTSTVGGRGGEKRVDYNYREAQLSSHRVGVDTS